MAGKVAVTINGERHSSIRSAARAAGISHSYAHRLVSERGSEIGPVIDASINRRQHGVGTASRPILIQGVWYPSQAIAAEVLGVSRSSISMAKKRGALDKLGKQKA